MYNQSSRFILLRLCIHDFWLGQERIVLPGLVVDSIRRASAHDFRHQVGKETEYSSHAVHVIDVQRAARP